MSNQPIHSEHIKTNDETIIETSNQQVATNKAFQEKINNIFKNPVIVVSIVPPKSNFSENKKDE